MEKKTLEERLADDILTDNAALKHYSQCKDCIFRDKRIISGVECGYDKCVCHIYGKVTAAHTNEVYPNFFPYTPVERGDKPGDVYDNTGQCEFYEKEKKQK